MNKLDSTYVTGALLWFVAAGLAYFVDDNMHAGFMGICLAYYTVRLGEMDYKLKEKNEDG